MSPRDLVPHSAEDLALRARLHALETRYALRWAAAERALAAGERVLAADRAQAAAELLAREPVAVDAPAIPEPVEGLVPDPPSPEDVDQLAASAAVGSPAHLAWRQQHVPNSNPFII